MIQEDQTQLCISDGAKKLKQKKVAQRGLGVAQLEQIRIEEEQQKKDASNTTKLSCASSTALSPTHSSSNYPKSSIPFRAIPQLRTEIDDIGWPTIPTHEQVNVSLPMLWQPYNNSSNCAFGSLPDVLPIPLNYQPTSSLVNVSSRSWSSPSPSSALSFSMDPPSSINFYSNHSSWWPDEEKMMVGMKRSCPFPSIPTFHGKFDATHLNTQANLSSPFGNGGKPFDFEPAIPIFREIPLCSSEYSKKGNGEFLSLAPTAVATSPLPNSRLKQLSTFLASHKRQFRPYDYLPYQGSIEDADIEQQPKSLSLFPTTKVEVSPSTGYSSYNRSIDRETIDLNLRL